jgi:aminoglycoside 6'-N-acetyltransferase I
MTKQVVAPLRADDEQARGAAAELLVEEFREYWPGAWPTLADAEREVNEALEPGKIALVARAATDGAVLGWIGAQPQYSGAVWELHPLVVRREHQGKGVGRTLVEHLEAGVADRGGRTIWLGTDDEAGLTSVAGIDLYPNVLEKLIRIRNLQRHPMGFYLKLRFEVVGIMPDANGFGKPDIYMAKRVLR